MKTANTIIAIPANRLRGGADGLELTGRVNAKRLLENLLLLDIIEPI
jgi:hypothetical protein